MGAYLYVDGLAASIGIEALITRLAVCGTVLSIELLPPVHEDLCGWRKYRWEMPKKPMGRFRS
jgi:hypothetical protein